MLRYLFLILICIIGFNAFSQGRYNISGIVIDEKGQLIKSATVFISGSERVTITGEDGKFSLNNLPAGNFQVLVSMLGYALSTEAVTLQSKSEEVKFILKIKPIVLHNVNIGSDRSRGRNLEVFKEQFLGSTQNGRQCVILNPEIISFGTNKGNLTAETDDFLIIENKRLGYRIRYRLRYFNYNTQTQNVGFDGDASFEQIDPKVSPPNKWAENRLRAYNGSLMHFLRSVYNNIALREGFLTYRVLKETQKYTMAAAKYTEVGIDKRPIKFDTVVNIIDDSFISLEAKHLYVIYNPTAAAKLKALRDEPKLDLITLDSGSTLKFYLNKALIDSRGSYADYRTFLIKGDWSKIRIGDQLPFEYQPAK